MNHEIYLPIIPQLPVSPIEASLRLRKRHAYPASEIPAQGRPVAESVLFHEYLDGRIGVAQQELHCDDDEIGQ